MNEPMFDTVEDMLKSQAELIAEEGERLTWYSNHPARKREEERQRRKEERDGT